MQWRWEDMCGPKGLRPWNDVTKDFGQCFQELFFQIPVFFILAIISGYYVGYRKDWVVREKTQERVLVLRSFIVLALVFIPIIELYVFITKADFVLYPVNYFAAGASCLAWLFHFGYVLALKHRLGQSSRGPTSQLMMWSFTVVVNLIALRSNIMSGTTFGFNVATFCCHVLYFFTLLPSSDSRPTFYSPCLVGSQHSHTEYTPLLPHMDEGILGTAMQGNGCLSRLLFSWVDPLLQKGLENKLNDPEELFDIPAKYCCSYVGAKIDRSLIGNVDNYQQYEDVPHEPFIGSGYGATGETTSQPCTPVTPTMRVLVRSPRRQNVSLLRALHSCFGLQFYSIGVLKLVSDMAGFAGPILLNNLIKFVEDESIDQHLGYVYAGSLLAATLISALFNVHFNWLMSIVGLKMRGAIVATILRKTLSVTSTELNNKFSIGEITNFMSTDTDRIVNSCPSFHALWSIPLQLFITLFLLYQQVGISFLAGVAFSVILIPINKVIANKIGQLSTELMKHKDSRISLISDLLKGIRTVKVHVWESYFIDRVSDVRKEELRYLRGRKYLDAICVVLWATTPVFVAALTFGTHALRGIKLDAPTVFTTVALINMLIAPLNAFPWVLNGLTEAWVSIKRIQKLLDLSDMDAEVYYDRVNKNHDEDKIIIFKNATFAWAKPSKRKKQPKKSKKNKGTSKKKLSRGNIQRRDSTSSSEHLVQDEPFMLKDINLEIGKEELIGITGVVGSGKSSLLHAIIGDMLKKNGDLQIPENLSSFGYVSQKPWLVRGTIRDNILFGKPYDEAKFRTVVDACALTEDLNVLGWNAYVGEGGCTLSGGQRARIALARAVYQDKQVYLLDDVLAGVDSTVAQHIMHRCILGLLRHTTRVLVAHSPRHLARAAYTVLMRDGRIVRQGPPETVLNDIDEYMQSETESLGEEPARPREQELDNKDNVSRNSLDDEETMTQGSVGWRVFGMYLQAVGVFLSIAILLSLVLMQLSQNFTFLWLTYWVRNKTKNSTSLHEDGLMDHVTEKTNVLDHGVLAIDSVIHTIINTTLLLLRDKSFANETSYDNTENQEYTLQGLMGNNTPVYTDNFYLEVYFGLAGLNLLFTIMRAFLFAYGGVKAAATIHKLLIRVVVEAKVKFFDITPLGRIVNRFSSDTYTIDDSLPFILNIFLAQVFSLIGAVAVTIYGLPWLAIGAVPLTFIYYRLQRRYRVTSRQLKRLQSVTLSPVYTHFNDTLDGLDTVRALGAGGAWGARGAELVEAWQRAALSSAAAAQWLALRLQAAAAAVVAGAALLAVLQRSVHAADPGLIGLAISYALSMTSMLSNVLNSFTETEREMIAVERFREYFLKIESENISGDSPPYGWPSQGVIEFDKVCLKFSDRESAVMALEDVSFSTHPGEKLGVVGRTGAGKSSLLAALLRLAPVARGRVLLDGVDISTLHLHSLRSRVGVIPQEPFIFSGSIRENVDPLRQYLDIDVWRALDACGLRGLVSERGGLGAPAAAAQLARGHAQLLCVVRALLHRPKVSGSHTWLLAVRLRGLVSERGGLGAPAAAAQLARGHAQLLCVVRALLHRPKVSGSHTWLLAVRLRGLVSERGGLGAPAAAAQLARGHAQLLCVVRALLHRPKVSGSHTWLLAVRLRGLVSERGGLGAPAAAAQLARGHAQLLCVVRALLHRPKVSGSHTWLLAVRLRGLVSERGGLGAPAAAAQLARGHAQLLCVVRALLHRPKVSGSHTWLLAVRLRGLVSERGGLGAPAAAAQLARGHAQLLCVVRALLHRPKVSGSHTWLLAVRLRGLVSERGGLGAPAAAAQLARGHAQLLCVVRALLHRPKVSGSHTWLLAVRLRGLVSERGGLGAPAAAAQLARGHAQLLCVVRALLHRPKVSGSHTWLLAVRLRGLVSERGGLGAPAAAAQLARGHAQLLCVVRALLHRPKILLVDEATANLDHEAERLILDAIRSSFGGSTVVLVAHRLTGVLECARVLSLGGGRVIELRAPDDALADHNSYLYHLVFGS